uniref:Nipped-B-like protein isoform X2 n=1 Tax=Rhizophora mucronata TaxID=61149 RepID=A0A2P2MD85_RHIMU
MLSPVVNSCDIQNLLLLQMTASCFNLAAIVPRISIAIERADVSLDFSPAFWSSKTQRTSRIGAEAGYSGKFKVISKSVTRLSIITFTSEAS